MTKAAWYYLYHLVLASLIAGILSFRGAESLSIYLWVIAIANIVGAVCGLILISLPDHVCKLRCTVCRKS